MLIKALKVSSVISSDHLRHLCKQHCAELHATHGAVLEARAAAYVAQHVRRTEIEAGAATAEGGTGQAGESSRRKQPEDQEAEPVESSNSNNESRPQPARKRQRLLDSKTTLAISQFAEEVHSREDIDRKKLLVVVKNAVAGKRSGQTAEDVEQAVFTRALQLVNINLKKHDQKLVRMTTLQEDKQEYTQTKTRAQTEKQAAKQAAAEEAERQKQESLQAQEAKLAECEDERNAIESAVDAVASPVTVGDGPQFQQMFDRCVQLQGALTLVHKSVTGAKEAQASVYTLRERMETMYPMLIEPSAPSTTSATGPRLVDEAGDTQGSIEDTRRCGGGQSVLKKATNKLHMWSGITAEASSNGGAGFVFMANGDSNGTSSLCIAGDTVAQNAQLVLPALREAVGLTSESPNTAIFRVAKKSTTGKMAVKKLPSAEEKALNKVGSAQLDQGRRALERQVKSMATTNKQLENENKRQAGRIAALQVKLTAKEQQLKESEADRKRHQKRLKSFQTLAMECEE